MSFDSSSLHLKILNYKGRVQGKGKKIEVKYPAAELGGILANFYKK